MRESAHPQPACGSAHREGFEMSNGDGSNSVVVSVQATGMEHAPWEGHITAGVLANESTVLIPTPRDEFLDTSRGFEALIIPTSLLVDRPIDRIRISGIRVLHLAHSDRVTSMVLHLVHPSRYPSEIAEFDGCDFNERLRQNGDDVWTALEEVEAIPTGLRKGPSPEVLRRAAEVEQQQRERHIRHVTYPDPGLSGFDICAIIRICKACRGDQPEPA
jgi:hypothetical protein